MNRQVDYVIRVNGPDGIKNTRFPIADEMIVRDILKGVLAKARAEGYRVVELDKDRWLAVKPGNGEPMEIKFLKAQREAVTVAVSPALVAFGVASVKLDGVK